jgi:hypothetical protein
MNLQRDPCLQLIADPGGAQCDAGNSHNALPSITREGKFTMIRKFLVCLVAAQCICNVSASSQKSGKSSGGTETSSQAQAGQTSDEAPSEAVGFSIETEMFTYKSVEENSAVIACDVARYLYASEVTPAPADAHVPCVVSNPAQTQPGIILVSANSSLLSDLQTWRTDMDVMKDFETRATAVCKPCTAGDGKTACSAYSGSSGSPSQSSANAKGVVPIAAGESLFATLSQMLARNESIASVGGTVGDDALINQVARQLRALKVQVLIPEIYEPNDGMDDQNRSPYFDRLEDLSGSEEICNHDALSYSAGDPRKATITDLVGEMQDFGKAITSPPPMNQGNQNSQAQSATAGSSHLEAVLRADRVARKLFPDPKTKIGTSWKYLLWLQALESGGSVLHTSNVLLGTKIRFSGGAVDTYALFQANGQLACSGNVYNFQSPVPMKDLVGTFHKRISVNPTDEPELQSSCPLP